MIEFIPYLIVFIIGFIVGGVVVILSLRYWKSLEVS